MSYSLVVNGNTYVYPQTGEENWGADASNWANAVTSGMLQKAGGTFTLTAEVDFGTLYGLKSLYYKSRTSNVAAAGQIRLARADTISFRNEANSADLALSVDATNLLEFNSIDLVDVSTAQTLSNKTLASPVITGSATFVDLSTSGTTTIGDASSDTVIFNARVASTFEPSADNTYDLGNSARRFLTGYFQNAVIGQNPAQTFTVNATSEFTGPVTLGDAVGDTITFVGRTVGTIDPTTDNTDDLGNSARRWANIYSKNQIIGENTGDTLTVNATASFTGPVNLTDAVGEAVTIVGKVVETQADIASSATINALVSSASCVRITGSTASTINGIAAGVSGQMITLSSVGANLTISNQSGSASAADRIHCPSAVTFTLTAPCSVSLVYDATAASWNVLSSTNTSAASVALADGTAAAPSLSFTGTSSNTGLFLKATDSLGFSANGTEVGSISSAGLFTMGNTSAGSNVHVANGRAISIVGNSAVGRYLEIDNNDNTATNSYAALFLSVGGATSTGDPYISFNIAGTTDWAIGVDNSASDVFQIRSSSTLGASAAIEITTANAVTIGTGTSTTHRLNTVVGTTVGAAGGASALPATPTGYITINVNGADQKIPYYAT